MRLRHLSIFSLSTRSMMCRGAHGLPRSRRWRWRACRSWGFWARFRCIRRGWGSSWRQNPTRHWQRRCAAPRHILTVQPLSGIFAQWRRCESCCHLLCLGLLRMHPVGLEDHRNMGIEAVRWSALLKGDARNRRYIIHPLWDALADIGRSSSLSSYWAQLSSWASPMRSPSGPRM